MSKRLDELKTMFAETHRRMQDEGKEALQEALQDVFKQHPGLFAVRWTQYTPYFNDGDPCNFTVNSPCIRFGDAPVDSDEYEDGFDSYSTYRAANGTKYPDGFKEAAAAINEVFRALPDELMLIVFGDHVQVTVTHEGFDIEECDHD